MKLNHLEILNSEIRTRLRRCKCVRNYLVYEPDRIPLNYRRFQANGTTTRIILPSVVRSTNSESATTGLAYCLASFKIVNNKLIG
jgi:hypothetical protein